MDTDYNNSFVNTNFLLVISAPSGTGKTTICKYLLGKHSNLTLSISATTRKPREGEEDGREYFFTTKEEFARKEAEGRFLESAHIFDNCYGTYLDFVQEQIKNGKNVLFDIDWQGMRRIKQNKNFNVATIFLMPPSIEALRARLEFRGDSPQEVERRLAGFKNDAEHAKEYDYVLINDNLSLTGERVNEIYNAEMTRFNGYKVLSMVDEMVGNKLYNDIKEDK